MKSFSVRGFGEILVREPPRKPFAGYLKGLGLQKSANPWQFVGVNIGRVCVSVCVHMSNWAWSPQPSKEKAELKR